MAIPVAKQYILDYENLGFGLFVHWGLYSQLGEGEWAYFIHEKDRDEYKKLKDTFTAEDFDAEELAKAAKSAGCRYITLTTRHHEGFSLFDTCGLTDFDSMHSPANRDLVREFTDACRKYDLVPFFYHTTLDWYNPDFENDFDSYLEYLRKSVEILCKNYGKIGGLWFDGNWSKPDSDWKEDELYATIRKYQPEAMIINNTGLSARGKVGQCEIDAVTFERGKPEPMNRNGMPKYLAAEMCQTINDHWGIVKNDINYKAPKELIENLCDCRRVGANFLLNIGPTAQGSIDAYQKALLDIIGKWTAVFGEAIYSGRPCEITNTGRHFVLKSADGKSLYMFCFDLGKNGDENVTIDEGFTGNLRFLNVCDRIKKIYWMDNNKELAFVQDKDSTTVNFTGYNYGESYCVRVAKAELDN